MLGPGDDTIKETIRRKKRGDRRGAENAETNQDVGATSGSRLRDAEARIAREDGRSLPLLVTA